MRCSCGGHGRSGHRLSRKRPCLGGTFCQPVGEVANLTEDGLTIMNAGHDGVEKNFAVLEMTACHGNNRMRDAVLAGKTMEGKEFLQIGERFLHDTEAGRPMGVPVMSLVCGCIRTLPSGTLLGIHSPGWHMRPFRISIFFPFVLTESSSLWMRHRESPWR